ncbi:glycosyltransferase [Paenibacillus sp. y28]|uniref:glycosyltransferase n=1 Tax=Paenibacillus sp. y28 TaxID=3129110 RepID=UPI0030196C79
MINKPLVSILIPAYNRPHYLRLALDSAIAQTYANIEIIVCDDSTNSEVADMIQPYLAQYPQISYFKNETVLFVKNWLKCLELSSGEYVNYLMDDDLFHPYKIERMMDCFLEHPDVLLVTSHRQLIDESGNNRPDVYATRRLFHEKKRLGGIDLGNSILTEGYNVIGEPTTVLFRKKDLIEPFGIFRGRQYTTTNDVATWLSFLSRGDAVYLPETLSYFRIHSGQNQNSSAISTSSLADWSELTQSAREAGFLQKPEQYHAALTLQLERLSEMKASPVFDHHHAQIDELRHRLEQIRQGLKGTGLKIDLGCGARKQPGYIGIDHHALPGVDIVCDLNGTIPLDDDTVDYVIASHSLEHIDHVFNTMKELYRICRHKAIVCIVAPYYNTSLNLANPYHKQAFNEHTPRFFTKVNSTLVPYEDYEFPHAVVWGLGESDHSMLDIDFRCVRMEFFYFPDFLHLSDTEKRKCRNQQANVVDQIMYHLVVNKATLSDEDLRDIYHSRKLEEPDHITLRRQADADKLLRQLQDPAFMQQRTGNTYEILQLQATIAEQQEQIDRLSNKLVAVEQMINQLRPRK